MEINIKGHSGCRIEIIEENNSLIIVKSTTDNNYFNRLILQAKKQIDASKQEYQHIRIPCIYDIIQTDNRTDIKMEYIYSKNFIEYFEQSGFEQINYFIKALKLFIDNEIVDSKFSLVSNKVILDKFNDVKHKIYNNKLFQKDPEIRNLVDKCEIIFLKQEDMYLPIGKCHGDLTFSNILFNGNNYFLIDFLDSFIESPIIDIVKLRQDTAFLWSQLLYSKSFDNIRLKIISNKIDKEISSYFSKYDWYNKNYNILQLMNFLRILQYAKENYIIVYLKTTINQLINEF